MDTRTRVCRILHVDVDAMFVQCAVMAEPERLVGEPLILVGGTPEGRGVVTSASYGCREYGVRSAMPMATALRLCPHAIVVRVPGGMVRTKSRALAATLDAWSPVAMMASVDEAYIDLTGTESLYHNETLEGTARRIQRDVKDRTGLDVSIGGGANRLVAKLATSFAKPAGVHVVPPGQEEAFVAGLEIRDLTGVGSALQANLRRHGITTMAALRELDLDTLRGWWGDERARWLWRRCRGIDSSPVRRSQSGRSISSETTFQRDTADPQALEEALLARVVTAAASLRKQKLFARTITVKLRDATFRDRSRARTLAEAVQTDRVIFRVARELLHELREQRSPPARLIGVGLTSLTETAEPEQRVLPDLAPPLEGDRERRLFGVIDQIREKYGKVIGPGTVSGKGRR